MDATSTVNVPMLRLDTTDVLKCMLAIYIVFYTVIVPTVVVLFFQSDTIQEIHANKYESAFH